MELIQTALDSIGNLFDDDPRTKGGIVLSAVVALSAALLGSLFRRRARPESERVKVTVDAPRGQSVSVRIDERTETI